jgi:hypothetical protein
VVLKVARRGRLRSHDVSLWEFAETRPLRDSAPIEASLTDDRADPIAGDLQDFDPVKHVLPHGTAAFSRKLPMLCQFRLQSVAAARGLRPEPGSGIRRRRLSGGRRGSAQLLFDSLAEVLAQMKAVSDLPRLRRPPEGSLSIEAAAIPADDLDFRMLAQPTGGRLRRAVRQHVDNLAPLQIDYDRAIAGPLSPTPIVDADIAIEPT